VVVPLQDLFHRYAGSALVLFEASFSEALVQSLLLLVHHLGSHTVREFEVMQSMGFCWFIKFGIRFVLFPFRSLLDWMVKFVSFYTNPVNDGMQHKYIFVQMLLLHLLQLVLVDFDICV
jgi:hypothetical protein